MPSRVNGISNLRIKLAFVPRPSAKVRLVHRKSSLSASATLSTICSAVEKRRSIIDLLPALGRAGVPDDIGPVIAALLSPSHRWINAQRIEVSGGWVL